MTPETLPAGWRVVLRAELQKIWLGWRGPITLLAFALFLSANVLLLALDPEINVLSQRKMINLTLQAAIAAGTLGVLWLSADAFSGERDQRSLESLLLTPVARRDLALGKLLAALSLWLAMVVVAAPYIAVVARGTDAVGPAVSMLVVGGTLVVVLSAGLGVLVSGLAPTNLASFAIAVAVLILLMAPTQLPGSVQDLPGVATFVRLNPITAVGRFTALVVDGDPWRNQLSLLVAPLLAMLAALALVPLWLDRRLSLQGGTAR